jgi:hypothetical protein
MKVTLVVIGISLLACLVRGETVESSRLLTAAAATISGDTVVWLELSDTTNSISAKNLATEQEQVVCSSELRLGGFAIGGDIVAWEDARLDKICIYAKNLATGQEYQVATNDWYQNCPAVSTNSIVVWSSPGGIFAKNPVTGRKYTVATVNPAYYWPWLLNPRISGYIVVYEEWTGENGGDTVNLLGMNLDTGKKFTVVKNGQKNHSAAIDGTTVVWVCPRGLLAKDLVTNQELTVCSEGFIGQPAISGDVVVWVTANGVVGKNIKTGRGFVFAPEVLYAFSPAISGDKVIYHNEGGVYLAVIPPLPTLKIERSGDSIVLSWTSSNYMLETRQSLSAPWQAVCSPSVSNCVYRAALSPTNAPIGFFRLQR